MGEKNVIIIIVLSLILLTGVASSSTVTYRWIPGSGESVASGITTNWGVCGAQPDTFVTTLLTTASTSGCSSDRHGSDDLDPATEMFFNTAYGMDTTVTGISYFGRLRDSDSGGGTFTFRLIYVFPNGTKVDLPGTAGSQSIGSGTSADYTVSLSGMSGLVPAGAKLGLRISKSGSSNDLRLYVGDTANSAGTGPSGYFSVDEVAVPGPYSITGLVTDTSGTPIASATVSTNTTLSATTNTTGWYIFTGVTNNTYLITATKTGYSSNTTTVTVNGANVTAGTIQLEVDYAEVTIDATTSTTNLAHKGQPVLVFINDTIGYMFYKDSGTATIGYSKTTDGGATWGTRIATTAQTDIVGFNIWYDRWTPGDTGTKIHIAMIDSGSDDVWYDTLDTASDTQGTEVAEETLSASFTNSDTITITKNTTGTVFIAYTDSTSSISKVRKCSTTCASAGNWTNAGTSPLTQTNDYIKLVPLASGNIMLIQDLLASNTVRSNIYRTNNTWSEWTIIDASVAESTTYTDTISATVDRSTNNIYLAYGADVAGAGTADIRTAIYNGTAWTLKTDVITNASTVTNFDIFLDENTGNIYVAYLRGTLTTAMNAYYKKSTDNMATWSAETKFNTVDTDLRWMYMNMMSSSRAYAVFMQNTASNDGLFGNTIYVNDVTPPNQVMNLTNTSIPTTHSINLGWDVAADNTGGSGIRNYLIDKTNDSFNYLTVDRPDINATGISSGYKNDAYWYTFRNNIPVNCSSCHLVLGTREFAIGNLWVKYNSTYLYVFAHPGDNDTNATDDAVELVFDPNRDGGTSPKSDDRLYELHEDGTVETFVGNGTGWAATSSNMITSVKGNGTKGVRFELAIPLSEIGSPANDSSVNFAFETECKDGGDSVTRATYFPEGAIDENPSTWTTITYRNTTVWDNIGTSYTNNYQAESLTSNFRYNFSVRAVDNANLIGTRSASYIGQTADRTGYNISGYITSGGSPLTGADVMTGEYTVQSDANGFYELRDLGNGTYTVTASASGYMSNSTSVTINGADQSNVNLTLQAVASPTTYYNNITGNSLSLRVNQTQWIDFGVTLNNTANISWYKDDAYNQSNISTEQGNFTTSFSNAGLHTVNVSVDNNASNTTFLITVNGSISSYNDSAFINPDNDFTAGEPTVYISGSNYRPGVSFKIAYYDENDEKRYTETKNANLTGNLNSSYSFVSGIDIPGTWHVQVYDASIDSSSTYESSNTDVIAETIFQVEDNAILEFPAGVVLPLTASFILYAFMSKRYAKK